MQTRPFVTRANRDFQRFCGCRLNQPLHVGRSRSAPHPLAGVFCGWCDYANRRNVNQQGRSQSACPLLPGLVVVGNDYDFRGLKPLHKGNDMLRPARARGPADGRESEVQQSRGVARALAYQN